MDIYRQLAENLREGKTSILYTSWQEDGRKQITGLQQEVREWIPSPEDADLEREVQGSGKPAVSEREGRTVVAEPFYPEDRLILLGGGHVALPTAEFASRCGFAVTVVDDRPEFANTKRFPWAAQVVCDEFGHALRELKIRKRDYVCIITRGHRYDALCLREILSQEEPGYLGMIGSRRRVAIVKEQLLSEGYSAEALGRLHSPIGLKIGGITPEEIAVSIVAELISAKRQGRGSKALRNQSDLDYSVIERLAEEQGAPGAVLTVIRAKGSVPRGAGAKMIAWADGRLEGSIGGGCSEAEALVTARRMIGSGESRVIHVDLTGEDAEDEGMVCGGILDVLIQDIPV